MNNNNEEVTPTSEDPDYVLQTEEKQEEMLPPALFPGGESRQEKVDETDRSMRKIFRSHLRRVLPFCESEQQGQN